MRATKKKISAGLILTDGQVFLGGHSTGNTFYDLPKGRVEKGETPLQACIREVWEESGLDVENEVLIDLGIFDYNFEKNLHLFLLVKNELPKISDMKCHSFFYHPKLNKDLPEADYFRYISFEEKEMFVTKNMNRVLNSVELKLRFFLNPQEKTKTKVI